MVQPTSWEISTFRMRRKESFSFRADKPISTANDTYCRFSLFEETYDSIEDARRRLANLHLSNPEGPEGERDYLSAMRTGFRVGNVTYILQTDGVIFWDEVQRLAKVLANSTPDADLTRAIKGRDQSAVLRLVIRLYLMPDVYSPHSEFSSIRLFVSLGFQVLLRQRVIRSLGFPEDRHNPPSLPIIH